MNKADKYVREMVDARAYKMAKHYGIPHEDYLSIHDRLWNYYWRWYGIKIPPPLPRSHGGEYDGRQKAMQRLQNAIAAD